MVDRIKMRRDTAANWATYNPVLGDGELGFERDTGRSKLGDGATAWTALAYQGAYDRARANHTGEQAISTITGLQGALDTKEASGVAAAALAAHEAAVDPHPLYATASEAAAAAPVQSVAGRAGAVVLSKADVGLSGVDNTSDATKNAATATLTNKTVNLSSNTLSGTKAQFNTALSDADFLTTADLVTVPQGGTGVATITGLVKGNGAGAMSAAVAGTDYQTAQSVTGMVKSSGVTRSAAVAGTDYTSPTGAETLSSKTITGGSINNTPIGATTQSTGAFTALSAATITQSNRIDSNFTIPNGQNALTIGPFEVGPDVTVTGLGNSTWRGL